MIFLMNIVDSFWPTVLFFASAPGITSRPYFDKLLCSECCINVYYFLPKNKYNLKTFKGKWNMQGFFERNSHTKNT